MSKSNPLVKANEEPITDFAYPIKSREILTRQFVERDTNFFDVVLDRKSSRIFNNISLNQLSEFLWYTSKVIDIGILPSGFVWTHRPAPSGGGRHPIDILISRPENRNDLFVYNPVEHSINLLNVLSQRVDALIEHSQENLSLGKGTLIWFIAHPYKTMSKYDNADSLIWRDAGALIYCMQICAEALNLNSCPLGSLGEPYVSDLFNKKQMLHGAGGLVLG